MGQNKQTKKGAGGGIAAGPQKNKKESKTLFLFLFFFFFWVLGVCNPRCADEPGGRPCPSDKTLCAGQGAGAPIGAVHA